MKPRLKFLSRFYIFKLNDDHDYSDDDESFKLMMMIWWSIDIMNDSSWLKVEIEWITTKLLSHSSFIVPLPASDHGRGLVTGQAKKNHRSPSRLGKARQTEWPVSLTVRLSAHPD